MAFDPVLALRVRDLLAPLGPMREVKMFGGLAFMVQGHMAVWVGEDELYVRLAREDVARSIAGGEAQPVYPKPGHQALGLAAIPDAAALDEGDLETWVQRSLGFVRTLPPKAIL